MWLLSFVHMAKCASAQGSPRRAGHLRIQRPRQRSNLRQWQVAGALQRAPVRVQAATASRGHAIHLDHVVQHHPRGQQDGQRIPAGAVARGQASGLVREPVRDDARRRGGDG